jgi:hypothetical protein
MHASARLALSVMFATAATAKAQIAFVKHSSLYVLPCGRTGEPMPGARPVRICKLWPLTQDDRVDIQWAPTGQIVLAHFVDAMNGKKRFGLSRDNSVSGIWILDSKPGAKPQRVAEGYSPTFSSDGNLMAYATDPDNAKVYVLNLQSHTHTQLSDQGTEPVWSADGHRLALIQMDPSNADVGGIRVLGYPAWDVVRQFPFGGIVIDPKLSPDGSKVAVHFHLSRPLTGHSLFDVATGKELPIGTLDRFAPPIVEDWSADGKWLLCDYRIEDPKNDGSWIKQTLGITAVAGGKPRLLSLGSDGRFSPDGRALLYLTDHKRGLFWKHGDLMRRSLSGGLARILAHRVDQFAVFRKF